MRKLIALALVAMAIVALAAAPAFAEGYNDSGYNFNYPDGITGGYTNADGAVGPDYANNAGNYTRATGYFSGPHGGYTTTTNKCQDCHSTHYATGSYKLLRANSAAAACDFCHAGGGGSTINIQMDNAYDSVSTVASDSMGYGTGHTMGYTGNAPADIDPAFSEAEGLACFSCHSPHGNSARIMTTFANPGRAFVGPGQQGRPSTADLNSGGGGVVADPATTRWPIKVGVGNSTTPGYLERISGRWGVDHQFGNFVWYRNVSGVATFTYRPIWPAGRFLLLKNPDVEVVNGVEVADTVTTFSLGLPQSAETSAGINKVAIDWDEPLGPADGSYGGFQDNDNNNAFPFAPVVNGNGGFLSAFEFCTDCHDGTAGASTQSARVWLPANNGVNNDGAYMTAYSHDVQPRH